MNKIDLTKMSLQELKAFAYDNLSMAEICQRNVQLANKEIAQKSAPTLSELPQVEDDKKTK